MNDEKRERKRQPAAGYSVQFNEKNLSYTGIVEDVSLRGLRVRICRINSKLMAGNTVSWFQGSLIRNVSEYMLVFSNDPIRTGHGSAGGRKAAADHFILTVRPCWRESKGNLTRIGFNIISYPENWQQFVHQLLPMKNLSKPALPCGSDSAEHLTAPFCFFGRTHCPEKNCCQERDDSLISSTFQPTYDSLDAQIYSA